MYFKVITITDGSSILKLLFDDRYGGIFVFWSVRGFSLYFHGT